MASMAATVMVQHQNDTPPANSFNTFSIDNELVGLNYASCPPESARSSIHPVYRRLRITKAKQRALNLGLRVDTDLLFADFDFPPLSTKSSRPPTPHAPLQEAFGSLPTPVAPYHDIEPNTAYRTTRRPSSSIYSEPERFTFRLPTEYRHVRPLPDPHHSELEASILAAFHHVSQNHVLLPAPTSLSTSPTTLYTQLSRQQSRRVSTGWGTSGTSIVASPWLDSSQPPVPTLPFTLAFDRPDPPPKSPIAGLSLLSLPFSPRDKSARPQLRDSDKWKALPLPPPKMEHKGPVQPGDFLAIRGYLKRVGVEIRMGGGDITEKLGSFDGGVASLDDAETASEKGSEGTEGQTERRKKKWTFRETWDRWMWKWRTRYVNAQSRDISLVDDAITGDSKGRSGR